MKKKLIAAVSLLLTMCLLLGVACVSVFAETGNVATTTSSSSHEAKWVKQGETTTACKTVTTYVCSTCGATKTETTYSDNHVYESGIGYKAATCTDQGYSGIATCKGCGKLTLGEVIPALGHDYNADGVCTRCGATKACDHTWDAGVVTTQPTCTTAGVKTFTCTKCSETKTEVVQPTGHNYDKNGVCTVCGATSDKHTHSWDKGVVTLEPSCEKTGLKKYTCTVCGATKTEEVCATGHDYYIHDQVAVEPTCTTAGYTTTNPKCANCGATYYYFWNGIYSKSKSVAELPALGHDYVNGVCTRCGDKEPGTTGARNRVLQASDTLRVYGKTRYGTGIAVADQLKIALGTDKFKTVIIANALNFPDALSGSYLACLKSAPILLVGDDNSKKEVLSYVTKNMDKTGTVYVLGGTSAVDAKYFDQVKAAFPDTQRISGNTRYDTNMNILKTAGIASGSELLIADASTAGSFADALSASSTGKPMMLIDKGTANKSGVYTGTLTPTQLQYLDSVKSKISKVTVLGGTSAVPDTVYQQLVKLFGAKNVSRIGGTTRYETSAKIAKQYFASTNAVTLAWGGNFPDALCGGPLAYTIGAPVVLTTTGDTYAPAYATSLKDYKVVAFGGTGVKNDQLTDAAVTAVKNAEIKTYYVEK